MYSLKMIYIRVAQKYIYIYIYKRIYISYVVLYIFVKIKLLLESKKYQLCFEIIMFSLK